MITMTSILIISVYALLGIGTVRLIGPPDEDENPIVRSVLLFLVLTAWPLFWLFVLLLDAFGAIGYSMKKARIRKRRRERKGSVPRMQNPPPPPMRLIRKEDEGMVEDWKNTNK